MMRPLVKLTSSRICNISSQPARLTAGGMNLVQMSRSVRLRLSKEIKSVLNGRQTSAYSLKAPAHNQGWHKFPLLGRANASRQRPE